MTTPSLTKNEKSQLLEIARETIKSCFDNTGLQSYRHVSMENCLQLQMEKYRTLNIPILEAELSCFVTLNTFESGERQLRGCIGTLEPRKGERLLQNMISNSIAAAFYDSRFEPLQKSELKFIKIEISILSKPIPISYKNKAELFEKITGKGLILRSGIHRATFLPQVWEQLPQPKDFLRHLTRKAGLFSEDYLSASYQVYEVYSFEESH